jgi:hypothetical protein
LRDLNPLSATLECFESNLPDLPSSFGGTSGGGLWRVYVRKRDDDGGYEAVHHRLIGIASSEDRRTPPRITCQGFGRIQAMIEQVLCNMSEKV